MQTSDLKILDITLEDLVENRQTIFVMMRLMIGEMREILLKKGQDYSGTEHTWANFEHAAEYGGLTSDQVFLALIGTKLARLRSLWAPDAAEPNYESIDDTLLDLANYLVLWAAYKRFLRKETP